MVRLGWCRLPPGVSWSGICLIGLLAGIGFTMSIFIAMLAFADDNLLGAAKLGVLLGSLVAAMLGFGWGAGIRSTPAQRDTRSSLDWQGPENAAGCSDAIASALATCATARPQLAKADTAFQAHPFPTD